jgi:XTP/dITP diphosphohydrolase
MAKRIIVASGNEGKIREIREILGSLGLAVVSMKDAGFTSQAEETGTTFEENALMKARGLAEKTDDLVLADDSGLEIDYLGKEPGIYSARYMGRDTSYDVKNQNLIDRLQGVPEEKRTARFVCAVAVILPDKRELVTRGVMEGRIGHEIIGENGFGYDPIFYLPEYGMTSAQIPPEEKNRISHRGKALKQMFELLKKEKL